MELPSLPTTGNGGYDALLSLVALLVTGSGGQLLRVLFAQRHRIRALEKRVHAIEEAIGLRSATPTPPSEGDRSGGGGG